MWQEKNSLRGPEEKNLKKNHEGEPIFTWVTPDQCFKKSCVVVWHKIQYSII